MKTIKICSDDFGMNSSVNDAILKLVQKGRLNSVSCMTTMDMLAPDADRLKQAVLKAPQTVEIGLHLTFTEYVSITGVNSLEENGKLPEIGKLLINTHLRQLNRAEVKVEIIAQLEEFKKIFGREPDFIDGHQHAHILPVIRETLLEVCKNYLPEEGWIRLCHQPMKSIVQTGISLPRSLLISNLARPMKRLLNKNNIKSNDLFLGINDFNTNDDYRKQMQTWLDLASSFDGETLIMCHPGMKPDNKSKIHDPIAMRRPDEFKYLASDEFIQDLLFYNLALKIT